MLFKRKKLIYKERTLGRILQKQPCIYYHENIDKCKKCEYRFALIIQWNIDEINQALKNEPSQTGWNDPEENRHYHLRCDLDKCLIWANKRIHRRKGDSFILHDITSLEKY